jgi:Mlc titration factor MtfA (ptsG expression regulator)
VIAAQACLLLAGIGKHEFFPRLQSILIYPGAYRDRRRRTFDLPEEESDVRLGESWHSGSVVLSWESVLAGAAGEDDGVNVVYHEFAHQLDQIDYTADGAPPLRNRGDYAEWSRIFNQEYEALVEAARDPRSDPLLDTYGAENPAEFFAVATEAFFEQPRDLKEEHPGLFEQLTNYFGCDPSLWE